MEARASAMAACDIGQCEPAALLLSDLSFSLAGRPPRWSIWPTRRQAVHRSDDKPVKGMNVSAADPNHAVDLQRLQHPLMKSYDKPIKLDFHAWPRQPPTSCTRFRSGTATDLLPDRSRPTVRHMPRQRLACGPD